jgi:prepilin signal peptidase PulO-like enzyme (type II secretory pathway)
VRTSSRQAFYGTFVVVFVASFLLMAAVAFDPNRLPEFLVYPLYPGAIFGFLFWWVGQIDPVVAATGGCLVLAFTYAVVALVVHTTWRRERIPRQGNAARN